ncbi:MAG: 50S ribosomal protein L29 [Mycoplasma sp.]|nr:50S ribosomal protein L29 [Mycoplasma sp.]
MTQKDLKTKEVKELTSILDDLKAKLFMLHFQNSTGQLDKTHQIKLVRKDVARVMTVIYAKQKEAKVSAKVGK